MSVEAVGGKCKTPLPTVARWSFLNKPTLARYAQVATSLALVSFSLASTTILYAFVPGSLTLWTLAVTAVIAGASALASRIGKYTSLLGATTRPSQTRPTSLATIPSRTSVLVIVHAGLFAVVNPTPAHLGAFAVLVCVLAVLTTIAQPSRKALNALYVAPLAVVAAGMALLWPLVQFGVLHHGDWPVAAAIQASEGSALNGYHSQPFGLLAITNATFYPVSDWRFVQVAGLSFEPSQMALLLLVALAFAPSLWLKMLLAAGTFVTGAVTGWLGLGLYIAIALWPRHLQRISFLLAGFFVCGALAYYLLGLRDGGGGWDIGFKLYERSVAELAHTWSTGNPLVLGLETLLSGLLVWRGWRLLRAHDLAAGFVLLLLGLIALRAHEGVWLSPAFMLWLFVVSQPSVNDVDADLQLSPDGLGDSGVGIPPVHVV